MARTMTVSIRVANATEAEARRVLDAAGLNLTEARRPQNDPNLPEHMALVTVEELSESGDGDAQRTLLDAVEAAMKGAELPFESHSTGVSIGGGSANHRWCRVTIDGEPLDPPLRALVGPGQDSDAQLDSIASEAAIDRSRLGIELPTDLLPRES